MNFFNFLIIAFFMLISMLMGFSMGKYQQIKDDALNRIEEKLQEFDKRINELKGI